MRPFIARISLSLILFSCSTSNKENEEVDQPTNVAIANEFIDAFYSFDTDSLATIMSAAESSQPNLLYYQGWAKCGHYQVIKRADCIVKNDSTVVCPVTVKDDLMAGLKIDFNVTDSFHITINQGKIRAVETTSNDLPEYYEAKDWVKQNRPEFIEKACEGIWKGGPTPCECIQGMVRGFTEYTASKALN
jgi:hypothetical protein